MLPHSVVANPRVKITLFCTIGCNSSTKPSKCLSILTFIITFTKTTNCMSMYNRRFTPENITHLAEKEVFVFGSNLQGMHGGGAARAAYERFGAVWGLGVGPQGQSYAIPTMHGGVEAIRPYVDQFVAFAAANKDYTFFCNPHWLWHCCFWRE